ncbi:MAG: hypothetical protein LBC76_08240 [Treponema sp.]|jgi:hypothetical protein|nr:hypothetical protein [Treponema sp.]
MKHYCEKCKTIVRLGDGVHFQEEAMGITECPFCFTRNLTLKPVPDHETLAQYKKRTGKPFPTNGLVFVKCLGYMEENDEMDFDDCDFCDIGSEWEYCRQQDLPSWNCNCITVIADPPVPPPDDWKPEEVA